MNLLQTFSQQIELAMKTLPETTSAFGDCAVGGYYLDFDIDRETAARYGLTVGDVQDVIQIAIGGMNITETVEGLERYPVNLRYPRELRDNMESLKRVLIPTPTGGQIPLTLTADLQLRRGPPAIKSENARPTRPTAKAGPARLKLVPMGNVKAPTVTKRTSMLMKMASSSQRIIRQAMFTTPIVLPSY